MFDDTDLDFQLNAAIEANPFQKRRAAKESAEKAPVTQPVDTNKDKAYPTTSNTYKPIGAVIGNERASEVKKIINPEPSTLTSQLPVKTNPVVQAERPQVAAPSTVYTSSRIASTLPSKPEPQKVTPSYERPTPVKEVPITQPQKQPTPIPTPTPVSTTYTSQKQPTYQPAKSELPKPNVPSTQINREMPPSSLQAAKTNLPTRPEITNTQQGPIAQEYKPQPPLQPQLQPTHVQTNIQVQSQIENPTALPTPPVNTNIQKQPLTSPSKPQTQPEKPSIVSSTPSTKPAYPTNAQKSVPTPIRPVMTTGQALPTNLKTIQQPVPTQYTTPPVKPRALLVSFNNNRGFMAVGPRVGNGQTADLQATHLGGLVQDLLAYPGPYRFDKKTLTDKRIDVIKFLEKKLSETDSYLVYNLSLRVLYEYLSNNSPSIFVNTAEDTREALSQGMYDYLQSEALSNLTYEYREYFDSSESYLVETENLSLQDTNWEDVLFKSLFLRNALFNIDSTNIDFILNYVRSKFAPGNQIHTITMVKLGFFHEIFETAFFTENSINDIWPLLIYPCLKYQHFVPAAQLKDFFNSFSLKILERHDKLNNGLLSLFIAILSGDFDSETFGAITKSCKSSGVIQILETYYFVLKSINNNFDKNYELVSKFLPLLVRYGYYLSDFGLFERSKDYIDYIVLLRPYYQGLDLNESFITRIKNLRDLIINHYQLIEEAKSAQKQTNFAVNKKEIYQNATNTIQKIQAKSKGLFGFMGSALSQFIKPNEESEQDERQPAGSTTTATRDDSSFFSVESKPNPSVVEAFKPPVLTSAKPNEESRAPFVKPHVPQNTYKPSSTNTPSMNIPKPTEKLKPAVLNNPKPAEEQPKPQVPPTLYKVPPVSTSSVINTKTDDDSQLPPMKIPVSQLEEKSPEDPFKGGIDQQGKASNLKNPFESTPKEGNQASAATRIKKIPTNRYVSPF